MSEPIVEVQNLTHHFKLTKKVSIKALDHVSFSIQKGEIFGLVGESGSGKSTAARATTPKSWETRMVAVLKLCWMSRSKSRIWA